MVAGMLGKETGLFVPSGTMGNEIAIHILTRPGDEVAVSIGQEHGVETMKDMSVVLARHRFGARGGATIGVVGPTRMDYGRTTSAVRWIARKMSAILARISGSAFR